MAMIDFEDRDEESRDMLLDYLEGRMAWGQGCRLAVFVPIAIALGMVAQVLTCVFWLR